MGVPSVLSFRSTTRRFVFNFRWWRDEYGGTLDRGEGRRCEDYGNEAHSQLSMKYSPWKENIFSRNTMESRFSPFSLSFFLWSNAITSCWERWFSFKKKKKKFLSKCIFLLFTIKCSTKILLIRNTSCNILSKIFTKEF